MARTVAVAVETATGCASLPQVKRSIDFWFDDHPADDEERPRVAWAVAITDDCDGCQDLRVELHVEDEGRNGTGLTAHMAPDTARRLRASLAAALRDLGEDPGA
jgi:hypothetical protein